MVSIALLLTSNFNDANWVSMGGGGGFAKHKTVHMLGEDIDIKLFDERIEVQVFFTFENRGPATTVKMAFPFSTVNWNTDLVHSFASKVDGKPVAVDKLKNVPMSPGEKKVIDDEWLRNEVYVKEVEFAKGQRRTVQVEYVTGRGFAGDYVSHDSYVLESGATWAGPIGNITITVDWSTVKNTSRPDLLFHRGRGKEDYSVDWQFTELRRATTTISNVEPDFNLCLDSAQCFWNVFVNGTRLEAFRGGNSEIGPFISGKLSDPIVPLIGIPKVFQEWADSQGFKRESGWLYTPFIEGASGTNSILLTDARILKMKRGLIDEEGKRYLVPPESDYNVFVHLSDFLDAIGGTMKWIEAEDRIDINLPIKRRPRKR